MSKVTAKNFVLSMEKDPKDPREGNYLDLCYKDFRNFKEKNGKDIIEFLSKLIKEQEGRDNRPDLIRNQKNNLVNLLKLIREGNEIKAFSNFHRTVPYPRDQEVRGIKPTVLIQQKENLKNVRKLINEGKERTAFSLFHRTFPYCMPYR
ncbi:MAG: hypothetical protein ACFE8T_01090 [Promethearchaeota archaeon]